MAGRAAPRGRLLGPSAGRRDQTVFTGICCGSGWRPAPRRTPREPLADRAEQQAGEGTEAAAADDEEIGSGGKGQQFRDDVADNDLGGYRDVRALVRRLIDRLLDHVGGVSADELRAGPEHGMATCVPGCDAAEPELGADEGCLPGGPAHRPAARPAAVDPYDDPLAHVGLPGAGDSSVAFAPLAYQSRRTRSRRSQLLVHSGPATVPACDPGGPGGAGEDSGTWPLTPDRRERRR